MLNKKRKASEENKVLFISQHKHELLLSTPTSNKPLWISDVNKSVKRIFPNPIDSKEFEQIKELMQAETTAEFFDNSDYPYYQTIKKIMFAFGDHYSNNHDTVIHMHDFIKKYLLNLSQIFLECDYKKIIDHFFSYEYEKIHNYKRLKFKNTIITGENASVMEEEMKMNVNDLNANIGNDNNNNTSNNTNTLLMLNDDGTDLMTLNKKSNKISADIDNVIEDKDDHYAENILFQSERTENMDTNQYLEYYSCRQHGFLTKGKKSFTDYLQGLFGTKYPIELKENANIELIAFILKEEIKKIIIEAIKSKHPDRKLFVLNYPLIVDDIELLCQEELSNLIEFLNDFHCDVSLIKIFKKKQTNYSKPFNKNVKVKKTDKGVFIIVKKYVLIKDKDEADQLKRIKKKSEVQVINACLILKDKLVKLKHDKAKIMIHDDDETKNNKMNFVNEGNAMISVKDLISYLNIDNYYEYYLIKDYLMTIDIKEVKLNELGSVISRLGRMSKKIVSNKFNKWIQMTIEERREVMKKFNELVK